MESWMMAFYISQFAPYLSRQFYSHAFCQNWEHENYSLFKGKILSIKVRRDLEHKVAMFGCKMSVLEELQEPFCLQFFKKRMSSKKDHTLSLKYWGKFLSGCGSCLLCYFKYKLLVIAKTSVFPTLICNV